MFVLAPNQAVETYPYSIGALRRDNPRTCFPANPSLQCLADWNVFPVVKTGQPEWNPDTQKCVEVSPVLEGGEWRQNWQVTDQTAEEKAARETKLSSSLRAERNRRLTESDWTVLADSPLTTAKKTEWKAYRTALRNFTAGQGFPFSVEWPTEPS